MRGDRRSAAEVSEVLNYAALETPFITEAYNDTASL